MAGMEEKRDSRQETRNIDKGWRWKYRITEYRAASEGE
jgi:hypothetical protein